MKGGRLKLPGITSGGKLKGIEMKQDKLFGKTITESEVECRLLIPPNIIPLMTGVLHARHFHKSGEWELEYTDGTKERAKCQPDDPENFFSIISAVQSKRSARN